MANQIPVKAIYTGSDVTSLGEYTSTDTIAKGYIDTDLADKTADNSWTGSQRGTTVTDNDGSFDMDGGNNFSATLAGNVTLTFTNQANGQSGYVLLDNSGGHTVSAHANTKVDANFLATVTTAGVYLCSYFSNGTNTYVTNSGAMS